MVRGVGFDKAFEVGIKMGEDRGGRKAMFQIIERSFAFNGPIEFRILLCQIYQQSDNIREVFNKTAIKVCKA